MQNKTSNINKVDLSGQLCLCRVKTDIEPYTGYNVINSPLYGQTITPLFSKTTDKREYVDKDGNYYDVSDTALTKNGAALISYNSTGFNRTTTDVEYESYAVNSNSILGKVKLNNSNKCIISYDITSYTFSTMIGNYLKQKIVASGSDFYTFILSQDSSSVYMSVIKNNAPVTDAINVVISTPDTFDSINPHISTQVNGTYFLISVINNFGNNLKGANVINLAYDTSAVKLYSQIEYSNSTSQTTVTYKSHTMKFSINKCAYINIYSSTAYNTHYNKNFYATHFDAIEMAVLEVEDTTTSQWTAYPYTLSVLYGNNTWARPTATLKKQYYQVDMASSLWESTGTYTGKLTYNLGVIGSFNIIQFKEPGYTGDTTNYYYGLFTNNPDAESSTSGGITSDTTFDFVIWMPTYLTSNGTVVTQSFTCNTGSENAYTGDNTETWSTSITQAMRQRGSLTWPTSTSWYATIDLMQKYYTKTANQANTYTTGKITDCEYFCEDGNFYTINSPGDNSTANEGCLETGTLPFRGLVSSVTTVGDVATVNYSINKAMQIQYSLSAQNVLPKSVVSNKVNIGNNYVRQVLTFSSLSEEDQQTQEQESDYEDNLIYVASDSTTDTYTLFPGVGASSSLGNDDVDTTNYGNTTYGSYQNLGSFRILYNNNLVSGVSYYTDQDKIGTLLSDWNTVDSDKDIVSYTDGLYYTDNLKRLVHIAVVSPNTKYQIISNKYIVINTTSYYNAWDIDNSEYFHYATDWNSRYLLGIPYTTFPLNVALQNLLDSEDLYEYRLTQTGQNQNYEITKKYYGSQQWNASVIHRVYYNKQSTQMLAQDGDPIDLYMSTFSSSSDVSYTYASYVKTFTDGIISTNPQLLTATYPTANSGNMLYSPNIFSTYISTYNNHDMIDNNGTSYVLTYSGQTPTLFYYFLSGIDGLIESFCIQSYFYGITEDNKILNLTYSDGVISGNNQICDITGLQYLGTLPTQAVFYSPLNNSLYSFTGDSVLQLQTQATNIKTIDYTFYNPQTQSLFLSCTLMDATQKTLVMSNSFMFFIDKYITDAFFLTDGTAILNDSAQSYYIRYTYAQDYTLIPIELETKFYGVENKTSVFDTIYFRFIQNGTGTNTGNIVMTVKTLTDKTSTTSQTLAVSDAMWDPLTNDLYYRYQAKYQQASGLSIQLTSPFPVQAIGIGTTVMASQLTHTNI